MLPDGSFAFPLVRQMIAAGLAPAELEPLITAALGPQYRGSVPQVTVSGKNPSGYQFSVIGKVNSPGTFTPGRYVNALKALTIAGGPSEFASVNNATILRKNGQQTQIIYTRLASASKGKASRWSCLVSVGRDASLQRLTKRPGGLCRLRFKGHKPQHYCSVAPQSRRAERKALTFVNAGTQAADLCRHLDSSPSVAGEESDVGIEALSPLPPHRRRRSGSESTGSEPLFESNVCFPPIPDISASAAKCRSHA